MKKAILLSLLTLAIVVPLQADDRERHQSYISYDDGGTVVRAGEDGREVEAHRNLPVYPGDEVITARRGRAEVHLSDGNIIGIDRSTAILFRSILDSYEGDADETVAELRHGKVAVQRTDIGRDRVRLDTRNASYVASRESIYSVETDTQGRDRVIVFDGSIEVRTPARSSRLRAGESAAVDDRGVYDLIGDQRNSADDFERWFLKRAERFGTYTSRYMDRRLSYWNDDLDDHGRWVFVTGIGWSWRPFVAVGWRPYYNGYWSHRYNGLTWVSYDPWAWGTYHYGRWAYDPFHGWIWVPGYGYSPAWVYWWYGPSYIGWAPSGWWDCHRGYYDWAYRPYRHAGLRPGFGFYGRVRVSDLDMRPWTFIDSQHVISNRVDRAALTTDAIKQRLGRSMNDSFATISGSPARFTREQLRDPAESIKRAGIRHDSGVESGTPTDLSSYFRRDPQVNTAVRDRVTRARLGTPSTATTAPSTSRNLGGGSSSTPSTGSSGGNINRGTIGGSRSGGAAEGGRTEGGRIDRSGGGSRPQVRIIGEESDRTPETPSTDRESESRTSRSWRDRVERPATTESSPSTPSTTDRPAPATDSWRGRTRSADPPAASAPSTSSGESSGSDVPRRVIDRIGGARVVPRDSDSGASTSERPRSTERSREPSASERPRSTERSRDTSTSTRERSTSRGDSGSRSSGSSVDRGGSSRSSGSSGGSSGGGSSRSSGGSSNSGGGNRESGGRIKKDG